MPITNYPNGLSSFGIPLIGAGPVFTTGKVFFVSSTTVGASDGNEGISPSAPLATIDAAVAKCTANNADYIIVMPGHVETVSAAAGLDLDVAGITLIGIGNGSDRPTIDFTTATTADMDVDAANITMVNFLFTGGIDALAGPIDINAADFTMIDCEFRDVTGQTTDWIVVATATAHRGRLIRPVCRGAAADGGDTWLSIREAVDGWVVEDPYIDGNFDEGCIENVTTACTNLSVYGASKPAFFRNRGAEDLIVSLLATTTGNVGPNIYARLADNAANITEAFAGADMQFFQPIAMVNLDGESSMETNITASTDA